MFYSGRPFVRLLLFLLAGIILARFIPVLLSFGKFFLLAVLLIILATSVFLHLSTTSYRFRWLPGLLMGMGVLWVGMSLSIVSMQRTHRDLAHADQHLWIAHLKSEPLARSNYLKTILQIQDPADSIYFSQPSYQVLAYIKINPESLKLHLGDALLFKGHFIKPEDPKNPEEFNYRNYLNNIGIDHIVFIKKNQWQFVNVVSGFSLSRVFARMRRILLQRLRDNGLNGREYSVAAAILLGDDQLIDPELHQNYAAAGAIHILCVSGMHVGIIFLVFSQLLFFLRKNKYGRLLRRLLLLGIIWAYAMLTGLSPSVTRAATMISLFIIAEGLQRSYDSYNVLAASAFLLLVFQPMLLFNVGFQLSYAAVLGIISSYKPIFRILYIKQPVFRILWAGVVLSFSAEMGVFPIAAHYFHIFPIYFLITNLAVFGLAYLILITGLTLLAFSWFVTLAHGLGIVLTGFIFLLNKIVVNMAQLPGSVQHNIYFPWFKVMLVYFFLFQMYFFLKRKNIRFIMPLLASIILLISFQTYVKVSRLRQKQVVVYAIHGHTALDFIDGKQAIMIVDSAANAQANLLNYPTENSRIKWGLTPKHFTLNSDIKRKWFQLHCGLATFNNKRIFILEPSHQHFPNLKEKIPIDFLVYRGRRLISLAEIMKSFQLHKVLIDASTSLWVKKAILRECKTLDIKCFDLRKTGAVVFK